MHLLACASPAGLIPHAGSEPLKGSGMSPPKPVVPTACGLRSHTDLSLHRLALSCLRDCKKSATALLNGQNPVPTSSIAKAPVGLG